MLAGQLCLVNLRRLGTLSSHPGRVSGVASAKPPASSYAKVNLTRNSPTPPVRALDWLKTSR